MPSETSFSFVRSISEMTSTRRAESGRPESDGENARSETFGALVSEAAQARNAERKNAPPAETPQEPVDPRPAPERRPAAEARAERANPRRSEEGDAHCNHDKAPPTAAKTEKTDKNETTGSVDEASGGKEKVGGEEIAAAEDAAGAAVAEPAKPEAAPVAPVAVVAGTVEPVPGETTVPAIVGGDVTIGGVDKTGGPMLPVEETPVPAAEAVAEETAGPVATKSEAGKTTSAGSVAEAETATEAGTKAGDAAAVDVAVRATPASAKEAGSGKTETAIEEIKAKTAEGESDVADGKTADMGKKTTTPDLNPTRLNRVADMLESFGLSHAIHRPADILAGLDRAVQASAMNGIANGAMNRATEVSRPTPLQMLPIEIGMQAVRGVTNFQIRLDPAELGRVDVKLQIRDNGEVNASLVVDRVETLAMLKRDASTLQQAFEQAGLRQSADGLSFSLRGEGQNGEARREGARGPAGENADDNTLQPQVAEMAMRRAYIPNSNLDLMI